MIIPKLNPKIQEAFVMALVVSNMNPPDKAGIERSYKNYPFDVIDSLIEGGFLQQGEKWHKTIIPTEKGVQMAASVMRQLKEFLEMQQAQKAA